MDEKITDAGNADGPSAECSEGNKCYIVRTNSDGNMKQMVRHEAFRRRAACAPRAGIPVGRQ